MGKFSFKFRYVSQTKEGYYDKTTVISTPVKADKGMLNRTIFDSYKYPEPFNFGIFKNRKNESSN